MTAHCGPTQCGYEWRGLDPTYIHRCALPSGPHDTHVCEEDVRHRHTRSGTEPVQFVDTDTPDTPHAVVVVDTPEWA